MRLDGELIRACGKLNIFSVDRISEPASGAFQLASDYDFFSGLKTPDSVTGNVGVCRCVAETEGRSYSFKAVCILRNFSRDTTDLLFFVYFENVVFSY